jgi:hypothetical protein
LRNNLQKSISKRQFTVLIIVIIHKKGIGIVVGFLSESLIMKKGILACLVASIFIGNALSFTLRKDKVVPAGTITGKISPADGAESVWAIAATDTLKTAAVGGNFSLQVKPGTYKLFVSAKTPYKNVLLDNLEVKESQVLDVGEIILQK